MTTSQYRGNTRLLDAEKLLEAASADGDYRNYEKAISAFEVAKSGGSTTELAERGRVRTQIAYAREALIRHDYDLAQKLVEPLTGFSREARLLERRIHDKRVAYRLMRRRIPFWTCVFVLGLGVAAVLGVNIYQYLTRGPGSDGLGMYARKVGRTLRTRTVQSVQAEYFSVYNDISGRRHTLVQYEAFAPAFEYLQGGYELVVSARDGGPDAKEEAYDYLREGLPKFLLLQAEILAEKNPADKEVNRRMIRSLQNLIGLLTEHEEEREEESDAEEE